jgi:predicted alpha/beta hydrolase family esterase
MFWFPWLKKEMEKAGFKVKAPQMPNPIYPRMEDWIPAIRELVKKPNQHTIFIGHSIGCQTILRYIEELPRGTKVGPVFLVAPFFELKGVEKELAKPWLESPMDLKKIKKHLTKLVSIFSDDDPLVPISNKKHFSKNFNSKIIVLKGRNHFVTKLKFEELLNEVIGEI